MKVHVGTDRRGLVHSVATGPASEGDITRLDDLLHGQERELFGDQAYWSEDHRQHCRLAGIAYRVNRRAKPGRTLTEQEKKSGPRPRAASASRCRASSRSLAALITASRASRRAISAGKSRPPNEPRHPDLRSPRPPGAGACPNCVAIFVRSSWP